MQKPQFKSQHRKYNRIAIHFDKITLDKLIVDETSCVELKKNTLHLTLHPFHLNDLNNSVKDILNQGIAKYDKLLGGILLGYRNTKFLTNAGTINCDSCFIHMDIEAEFFVFKPEIGCVLTGIVNKKSEDHVGCLIYNTFNVSLPKPEGDDNWEGESVEIGQEIQFRIIFTSLEEKLPYIRAVFENGLTEQDSGFSTSEETQAGPSKKVKPKKIKFNDSEQEEEMSPIEKHKKKRKRDIEECVEEEVPPKKRKHKKHKKHDVNEHEESEIEYRSGSTKQQKIKDEQISSDNESPKKIESIAYAEVANQSVPEIITKKKKTKKSQKNVDDHKSDFSQDLSTFFPPDSSTKTNKDNYEIADGDDWGEQYSYDDESPKKHKHKRTEHEEVANQNSSEVISKKKKSKKWENDDKSNIKQEFNLLTVFSRDSQTKTSEDNSKMCNYEDWDKQYSCDNESSINHKYESIEHTEVANLNSSEVTGKKKKSKKSKKRDNDDKSDILLPEFNLSTLFSQDSQTKASKDNYEMADDNWDKQFSYDNKSSKKHRHKSIEHAEVANLNSSDEVTNKKNKNKKSKKSKKQENEDKPDVSLPEFNLSTVFLQNSQTKTRKDNYEDTDYYDRGEQYGYDNEFSKKHKHKSVESVAIYQNSSEVTSKKKKSKKPKKGEDGSELDVSLPELNLADLFNQDSKSPGKIVNDNYEMADHHDRAAKKSLHLTSDSFVWENHSFDLPPDSDLEAILSKNDPNPRRVENASLDNLNPKKKRKREEQHAKHTRISNSSDEFEMPAKRHKHYR